MAIVYKCKMCGASLDINEGDKITKCSYCHTQQTLPKISDDERANLYDRANHFRRNNDYDKAMALYEKLLNADTTDAEAYWSLILCKYGIEYVEDTRQMRRVPTINRMQYTSVLADEDYKSALEYADISQREIYETEAKEIDQIQKGILAISQKEEPFDVFICYKESDENGRRTPDSVLAQELYYGLTNEGFKVFFARITLEDKLGSAYEPYIFAALNSAKVMVALGTKPEHFNAVWVKNEWSRFLGLMKKDNTKTLIPAYKDMDAYDLPEDFSHLQAQDMSKLGFMQDLIRGIKKIVDANKQEKVTTSSNGNVANYLKRIQLFIKDGDFDSAREYCEKVLDLDPENADAYFYRLMADYDLRKVEHFKFLEESYEYNSNYRHAYEFGDTERKAFLKDTLEQIKENIAKQNKLKREQAEKRNAEASRQARINEHKQKISYAQSVIQRTINDNNNLQAQIKNQTLANEKLAKVGGKRRKGAIVHIIGLVAFIIGIIIAGIAGAMGIADLTKTTEELLKPENIIDLTLILIAGVVMIIGAILALAGISIMLKNNPERDYSIVEIFIYCCLMFLYDIIGIYLSYKALKSDDKQELAKGKKKIEELQRRIEENNNTIDKYKKELEASNASLRNLTN